MRCAFLLTMIASLGLLLGVAPDLAVAENPETVVARVGRSELTVQQVERRLARLPPFQLAALGSSPEAAKRRYVTEVLLRELLLDQAASEQNLDRDPAIAERLRGVLAEAFVNQLKEQQLPVTEDQVRRAFEAERVSLGAPRRIRIYRILLGNETEVRKVIEEARGTAGLERWATTARERSLDKATNMRSGDLGFVRPDGSTDVPELRVDPVLFAAAERVGDGALVSEPVKEGERYAAVWRRGSLPAEEATFGLHADAIRQRLAREQLEKELSTRVHDLRQQRVKLQASELVDQLTVDPFRDFRPRSRTRPLDRAAPSASAASSRVP